MLGYCTHTFCLFDIRYLHKFVTRVSGRVHPDRQPCQHHHFIITYYVPCGRQRYTGLVAAGNRP